MIFDSRLSKGILQGLKNCISIPINGIYLQNGFLVFSDNKRPLIECRGKLRITFKKPDNTFIHLDMISSYNEVDLLVDQGKIELSIEDELWTSLQKRLSRAQSTYEYHCSLNHENQSPINKIVFYGNRQENYLNVIYPDIQIERLRERYGFNDFPFVSCNSIEFVVFRHNNDRKTIFILQQGGFQIILNQPISDEEEVFDQTGTDKYPINGYMKNIVIQHVI